MKLYQRLMRRIGRTLHFHCNLPHYYSQEGEDAILARVFEGQAGGYFVDVGAHHPTRFSNTYYFYKRGWKGINIDATPGSMAAFNAQRPLDINIESGVSSTPEPLEFCIFNEPALNTFDKSLAKERDGKEGYYIDRRVIVDCQTLAKLLDKHLPAKQRIDFLSVDVEGFDMSVLESNNWERYRPKVLVTEDFGAAFVEDVIESEVAVFLRGVGYRLFARTAHSNIFKQAE